MDTIILLKLSKCSISDGEETNNEQSLKNKKMVETQMRKSHQVQQEPTRKRTRGTKSKSIHHRQQMTTYFSYECNSLIDMVLLSGSLHAGNRTLQTRINCQLVEIYCKCFHGKFSFMICEFSF